MLKNLIAAAALTVGIASSPAAAVTFDAFTSFDGTQGAGGFFYGYASDTYSNGTPFAANTNCFIAASICLQQSANNDVPGFTKSTATSFQYNSVNVPDDRLLLHPGNDGATNGVVFIAFTAPVAGTYTYTLSASVQDVRPSGILIGGFSSFLTPPIGPVTSLNASTPTFTETGSLFLVAGQSFGFSFNRDGTFNNDSTGLNFSLATVPEPATWGLMIIGFGLVGVGLRRKAALAA